MDRRTIATLVLILGLMAGAVAYLALNDGARQAIDKMATEQTAAPKSKEPEANSPTATTPGNYIDYSTAALNDASGTKLLFFHAPWCPQCRDLEADIKRQGVPAGVTILKVDYDSNQKLRQQYGVTIQTTVVKIDESGQLVEKYVAYDAPTLDSLKKNLLQ